MCSIPGLPTPGSEVPVLITRVNLNPSCGLVELWVSMEDGREPVYEQMRQEIQVPEERFCGSEGEPGDLCLVCISDTWHRARIISIQSETYNVFLTDQGQPHIATSEALAWAHSDRFLLPPEIESCILANILSLENNWPEKATKFLKSLPGKKFKARVQHVLMPDRTILLDIPIVSKHIATFGVAKKIPGDEFKCLVLKYLYLPKGEASEPCQEQQPNDIYQSDNHGQYFYPELLTEAFEGVNVTEVVDPQNFFCQLLIFSKAVKMVSEELQKHYEDSSDFEREVQPQSYGDPCAARGMNGRWHRSLLQQNVETGDHAVIVLHVDEGKTEFVPVRDIRPLHEIFLRMPVITFLCSLDGLQSNGTEWTTEQTDYLKLLLLNQTLMARFEHHDLSQDVYYVTLYASDAACLNSCFLEKAGILPASKTEPKSNVQKESIPSSFLGPIGDKWRMDLQNKVNVNVDDLQEQTLPSTKNLEVNSKTDAVPHSADDIHSKGHSDHPGLLIPSEVHNACDDGAFTVGSTINVKVSCIESLPKFWCQSTENGDSLRLLMQDLQNHYASTQPPPLVESICVARNPDNDIWYRARILASHHSPVVDVRFIDYGQTRKIPLQDVRPIDPAFFRLNALAFQCCLSNPKNSPNPTAVTWTDAALAEFQKSVDLGITSNIGLRCVLKAITSDGEGQMLNVVDIETPFDHACKLLTQKCAQPEVHMQIPLQVPSDAYTFSTHNIEVGGKENVWVTSSESVNHFYCQLDRNSHLFDKLIENVEQLINRPQCTDRPLGLKSVCFARYTDDQWYRGQILEMSPKLKVHFVDFGDTLAVNESDIRPFPAEGGFARSVPVQAVPLGLFDIPGGVPQKVNQWFADHAIGQSLTISVVAKEANGKLIVELFDGSLNVNVKVKEMISKMAQQKMTDFSRQTDQATVPNEDGVAQELMNGSVLMKITEQNKVQSSPEICTRDELKRSSYSITNVSAPTTEQRKTLDERRQPTLDVALEDKETLLETFMQDGHSDTERAQLSPSSCTEGKVNICMYKKPNISQEKAQEVYASCIGGPHYFWCQYTNTEDLSKLSVLTQEAGQAQQDMMFTESLGPGSPCLALFSINNQWYRAQVTERTGNTVNVVFIDYGNESDVDISNVRSLPQSLLEVAPQAFLCSLSGFDESEGTWDDRVYEDFYNMLVDKPLGVTVFNTEDHPEVALPQYAVQIECENVVVNHTMQKYWKPDATEHFITESPQTENSPQGGQTESNMAHPDVSKGNANTSLYKNPKISKNQTESVYASCIVEPCFFWCQYANTEDLNKLSVLSQEAGQAQQDMMFTESLGPGSPCLALFSSDNQWYRAQVTERTGNTVNVVFIDYGNESDVDISNVRSLPQSLLEVAPQAFLCSLSGFDESKGTWDDQIYEDFYNLLVDKPLRVTVFDMEDHSKAALPQYAVEVECEGVVVNTLMEKYWKGQDTDHAFEKGSESVHQDETRTRGEHWGLKIMKTPPNECCGVDACGETQL